MISLIPLDSQKLTLGTTQQLTCNESCEVYSFAAMPYAKQAYCTAGERVCLYNQGWQLPGVMPERYPEVEIQRKPKQLFLYVAKLQKDFWQIAFKATALSN